MSPNTSEIIFGVSDFVAVFNQTIEFAYPSVTIVGELANFKINKNQWLRFSLKDDFSSVNFFGTKYNLPGPIEEGMLLKVKGYPRLHPLYGFSINIQSITVSGEGSIKRAFNLLQSKLEQEGLFDPARKRSLPYPPEKIGLITSIESAAYADFRKVLGKRWSGLQIEVYNSQVQGETAGEQLRLAVEHFNGQAEPPDVLVITRGGGSPDDLAVFNTEAVVRAIAASRVPTLAAIGHEIDLTLTELAADQRGSTPSNAAELLVPDKRAAQAELDQILRQTKLLVTQRIKAVSEFSDQIREKLYLLALERLKDQRQALHSSDQLIKALSPTTILRRGYVVVRDKTTRRAVKTAQALKPKQAVNLEFSDGIARATINGVK